MIVEKNTSDRHFLCLRHLTAPQFQILRRVFSPTGPPAETSRASGGRSTPPRAPTTSSSSCDLSIFALPFPNREMYPESPSDAFALQFPLPSSSAEKLSSSSTLPLQTLSIGRIAKRYIAICTTLKCSVGEFCFSVLLAKFKSFLWSAFNIVHILVFEKVLIELQLKTCANG